MLLAYAQPAAARALFAYPIQGQSPEQENADRAACHQWAVEQSGFDPMVGLPAQERSGVLAGVAINARPGPTGSGRLVGIGGGGGSARREAKPISVATTSSTTPILGPGKSASRQEAREQAAEQDQPSAEGREIAGMDREQENGRPDQDPR